MSRVLFGLMVIFSMSIQACAQSQHHDDKGYVPLAGDSFTDASGKRIEVVVKRDEEWKKQLDPLAFYVLREKGTERAFTGQYHDHKGNGIYACKGCGLELFASDTKFDSGTGWPSFFKPLDPTHLVEEEDYTLGMSRVEVMCRRCGGHLGHVFNDGPRPTGLRYCMNSVSLDFIPGEE